MQEKVRFHFDPLCPWAWQSARWLREVEKVRPVEVDWRLFSLKLVNQGQSDPLADAHVQGTPALRTLALVRREGGNRLVGRLYERIGEHVHERGEDLSPQVVKESLMEIGLDGGLLDRALADDSTMEQVRADYEAAVSEAGCFGVPTIVTSSGKAIFGPVVSTAPPGEAAGELWDHVRWLMEQDTFFELKRERDRPATSHPAGDR